MKASLLLALALTISLSACRQPAQSRMSVAVASADTPEQMVLGKMTVLALRAAGYDVTDNVGMDKPWVVRAALESGSIDICWEYTGDAWLTYMGHDRPIADPQECYQRVRQEDANRQITWLAMAPAQRTMVLLMREADAQKWQIATVSDLSRYMAQVDPELNLCVPEKLYSVASGIRGLESVYHLQFKANRVRLLSMTEGYRALRKGECDCALGSTTDGDTLGKDLRVLGDDLAFFHASNLAPNVRTSVLQEFPQLEATLGRISRQLTQAEIIDLNQRVVEKGEKPESAARRFLNKYDLLKRPQPEGNQTPRG